MAYMQLFIVDCLVYVCVSVCINRQMIDNGVGASLKGYTFSKTVSPFSSDICEVRNVVTFKMLT